METEPAAVKPTWGAFVLETVKTVLIVTLFAVVIRTFLVQPFIVEGHSMESNYHNSDYLLIDKLSYRVREPHRGEVIVFVPPEHQNENYIKRIIGLPGERIVINSGIITIYNSTYPQGAELREDYLPAATKASWQRVGQLVDATLGDDELYVLGDNRLASTDSRVFGPIKRSSIIGRSYIRLFPLNDVTVFASGENLTPTE